MLEVRAACFDEAVRIALALADLDEASKLSDLDLPRFSKSSSTR